MLRAAALAHVANAVAAVLNREPQPLNEQDRLFDDLALDSMTIMELLLALEDEASIGIDPDELGVGVFDTVGTLTSYVESKLASSVTT
ncbi:acyl carrier protein [Lentzea sp. NPDC058436]|uniref:acyl carrier protein n=1 Tax=Lentzea sp. NPDC058436 TaxID=3346499 RepID=UPI003652EFC4